MSTTNVADCTNSFIEGCYGVSNHKANREFENACRKLMKFYEVRHRSSLEVRTRLTPYAKKILSNEFEGARRLGVRQLDRRSCYFQKWGVLGIPYLHVVASITMRGVDQYDYCEQWFWSDSYVYQ